MGKNDRVARPTKKGEYELRFATRQAEKGWRDLSSTLKGPLADAWDFLTNAPTRVTPRNYPLRGQLATVTDAGEECQRWQHKPTARGDARIWFFVRKKTVYLEAVHTHHPNQTK